MKKVIIILFTIVCIFGLNNNVSADGSCDFNAVMGYNSTNSDKFVYIIGGTISYGSDNNITSVIFTPGSFNSIKTDGGGDYVKDGFLTDARVGNIVNVGTKFSVYDSVTIYGKDVVTNTFYVNKNIFFENRDEFDKFNTKFKEYLDKNKSCPKFNYSLASKSEGKLNTTLDNLNGHKNDNAFIYNWKLKFSSEKTDSVETSDVGIDDVTGEASDLDESEVDKEVKDWFKEKIEDFKYALTPKKNDEFVGCSELLGEDLAGMLHTFVNVVKIVVALVLIVLGVVDFASAILAQDEGSIKKAQNKFIRRLLYAAIFFLAPTIIRLLLTVANTIWPSISVDLCGIL